MKQKKLVNKCAAKIYKRACQMNALLCCHFKPNFTAFFLKTLRSDQRMLSFYSSTFLIFSAVILNLKRFKSQY